jgi:hypothetical protein
MSKDLIFKATKRNWSRGATGTSTASPPPVKAKHPTRAERARALKLSSLRKGAKGNLPMIKVRMNGGRCDALDGVPFVGDEERASHRSM